MNTHVRDNLDALKIVPVTALPGSPFDGQLALLTDSHTAPTWQWMLMYDASISGPSKWRFLGGPPLFAEDVDAHTTVSTSYIDLGPSGSDPGPSIAVPVAGSIDVEIGCRVFLIDDGHSAFMSYAIGGTAAVDADALEFYSGASDNGTATVAGNLSRPRRKTLTAVTLTAKYKVSGGTGSFSNRWIRGAPVLLG
jgi:hypothetical protein